MKLARLIYLPLLAVLAATGCVNDNTVDVNNIPEGLDANVSIKFGARESDVVVSRSTLSDSDEARVRNLYILIFDKNGNRATGQFFDGTTTSLNYTDATRSGTVQLNAKTGSSMTIYGIANIDLSDTDVNLGSYSLTKDQLDAVDNISELNQLQISLRGVDNNSVDMATRQAKMLMRGALLASKTATEPLKVNITETGVDLGSNTDAAIYLNRVDAKVKFVVKVSDASKTDFEFNNGQYRVMQIPTKAYLMGSSAAGSGFDYAGNINSRKANNFEIDMSTGDEDNFSFYILESNLKTEVPLTAYRQRDLKDKGTTANNAGTGSASSGYASGTTWDGSWAFANDKSTYVQITGRISYKKKIGTTQNIINADVTYNIHLGNFASSATTDTNRINDFWTKPNTSYTYNITIKGIDDIIAEVKTDDNTTPTEKAPGAEGDVVRALGSITEVDCHYASVLLKFNPSQLIAGSNPDQYTWFTSTPYRTGVYKSTIDLDANYDYKWIQFYIHQSSDSNTTTASYAKYMTWQKARTTTPKRMYVNEFVNELKKWHKGEASLFDSSKKDADGNACVTAFVNEYYYDAKWNSDPDDGTKISSGDYASMWRTVVNGPDRILHIFCKRSDSADGSSSVTESAATIIQHPMQTIFNTSTSVSYDIDKPIWGLELKGEEGQIFGRNSKTTANSSDNGLYNTNVIWGSPTASTVSTTSNRSWTTYLELSASGPQLKTSTIYDGSGNTTKNAIYACMTRNRDNNGNGKIDREEIRWYMAAEQQLTAIFIGEDGLRSDAKLYQKWPEYDKTYHHLSSTGTSTGGRIVWSEEGSSTGDYNDGKENPQHTYYIRCVRNIGYYDYTAKVKSSTQLQKYGTVSKSGDDYIIDLAYLNTASLRGTTLSTDGISLGHERSAINHPWKKFKVWGGDLTYKKSGVAFSNGTGISVINILKGENGYKMTTVCPEGYRIPLQREMAIMHALMPNKADDLWTATVASSFWNSGVANGAEYWQSCTFYSLGNQTALGAKGSTSKDSFKIGNGNTLLTLAEGAAGAIRCVKDVE